MNPSLAPLSPLLNLSHATPQEFSCLGKKLGEQTSFLGLSYTLLFFLYKNTTFKENFQQDETDKIVYYG